MTHNQRTSIQFHTAAKGIGESQRQRSVPHFLQSSVPGEHVILVPAFDIACTAQGQHVIQNNLNGLVSVQTHFYRRSGIGHQVAASAFIHGKADVGYHLRRGGCHLNGAAAGQE